MHHPQSTRGLAIIFAVSLSVFLAAAPVHAQGTFRSTGSGSWTSASTWTLLSGTDKDGVPDANDVVTVRSGDTVRVSTSTATCSSLTVAAGGVLWMLSGGTLPSATTYSLDPASTTAFVAAENQIVRSGVVYGNLLLSGSGVKTVSPIPTDTTFRSRGVLTVAGTGVRFDVSTAILHIYFDGNVIVQPTDTLDASVGITVVTFSGSSFVNNGTFLTSSTSGFGYTPTVTFNGTTVSGAAPQTYYDLVINGPMTATGPMTVIRHLTILSSGSFVAGSYTHTVGGNWTNNGGSFTPGSGTIVLQHDSVAQVISGGVFNNLVLNNRVGIQLSGATTIGASGTLTLQRGTLSTGSASLTIANPALAALALDTNRVTGTVTRAIQAGATASYKFFNANAFVTPSGTANPSAITMTERPGSLPTNLPPTVDSNMIARRTYTFSAVGAGAGFTFGIQLPYLQSEVRGAEALYTLYGSNGSSWASLGTSTLDTAANYLAQTGLPPYAQFVIAEEGAALPVQLASFVASVDAQAGTVHLTWKTASETNNFGFAVEMRAGEQGPFTEVPGAFVAGNHTTVEEHNYGWTSASLAPGAYAFRLRQIDLTGDVHYSEPVRVDVGAATGVTSHATPAGFVLEQNYPNPFNPTTEIRFTVEKEGRATVAVYNLLGQIVATLFEGSVRPGQLYSLHFDASNLPNGAYFYTLVSGGNTALRKMLLLK